MRGDYRIIRHEVTAELQVVVTTNVKHAAIPRFSNDVDRVSRWFGEEISPFSVCRRRSTVWYRCCEFFATTFKVSTPTVTTIEKTRVEEPNFCRQTSTVSRILRGRKRSIFIQTDDSIVKRDARDFPYFRCITYLYLLALLTLFALGEFYA